MGLHAWRSSATVRQRIQEARPYLLIGSPPCTDRCALHVRLNHPRMDPGLVARRVQEAKVHLAFVLQLYQDQLDGGRHFLHEHPASATSWCEPAMLELLTRLGVNSVVGHMCRQGMQMPDPEGVVRPVLKPTRWASSAETVLETLAAKCPNNQYPWRPPTAPAYRPPGRQSHVPGSSVSP